MGAGEERGERGSRRPGRELKGGPGQKTADDVWEEGEGGGLLTRMEGRRDPRSLETENLRASHGARRGSSISGAKKTLGRKYSEHSSDKRRERGRIKDNQAGGTWDSEDSIAGSLRGGLAAK